MKTSAKHPSFKNESGFIMADFLFSFVMVVSISIFIFGLTFSLATIEVAQYIVWSSARAYAAGNKTKLASEKKALDKFKALAGQFPGISGSGSSPWFILDDPLAGDLAKYDSTFNITQPDKINDNRQPWTGFRAQLTLKLFSSFQLPFLGKVADDPSAFRFPVRAFLIRNPSQDECQTFFYKQRYEDGILKLPDNNGGSAPGLLGGPLVAPSFPGNSQTSGWGEDNGC